MSWSQTSLKEATLRVAKIDPATLTRETFRYVDIGSVSGERHAVENAASVPIEDAPGRARQLLREGDTVFSTVRPYLQKIGYIGSDLDGEIASTGFCVLRPTAGVEPRFLFHFATSRGLLDQVLPLQRGVSYPAVRDRDVLAARIPLPPREEQRRIVDILEDHLSRLDAGVQSLDAAYRKFDGMRVTRVRQLLPPSTPEATLGSVTRKSGYGTSTKCVYDGPGAAVTRIPNLVGGCIDLSDLKRIADPAVSVTDLMLQEGDLLVIRTNGSRDLIGRSAVVQAGIRASFASYLIRFQLDPTQVIADWVHLMLSTPGVRRAIETRAASSAGQYNLSLAKLNTLSLPLPTIDEQAMILNEMQALDASTIRLAATLRQAHHRAASLRRALLTAAFSGKLTGAASDSDRIEELAATT